MKTRIQRLTNFLHRPRRDQLLFFQVYILLGLARLAIILIPFPRLVQYLGKKMAESSEEISILERQEARRIAWAIRTASHYTPWKSNCFPQAITAKYLLQHRGINSTLYLGAAFTPDHKMEAHAWLRCGSIFVTGGAGDQKFGTVASFS